MSYITIHRTSTVYIYQETKCVLSGQKATLRTQDPCPDKVPARLACCLKWTWKLYQTIKAMLDIEVSEIKPNLI